MQLAYSERRVRDALEEFERSDKTCSVTHRVSVFTSAQQTH